MSHAPILPILIPMFTGVLMLLFRRLPWGPRRAISVLAVAVLLPLGAWLLQQGLDGPAPVYRLGDWPPPFGIVLVVDGLAATMVTLTAALALPVLFYASRGDDRRGANFHALFQFELMGLNGAFLTGDIFNLFVFFEVLLIASYGLMLHGGGPRRTSAGLHYVVMNLAGSALFLIALGLIYGAAGTLNLADLALVAGELEGDRATLLRTGALLLLVVFGLKAAVLPLYFWLPRAYSAALGPVAALFAVMTKVGVYALLRVSTLIFGAGAGALAGLLNDWLWPLALLTLLLGGLGALTAVRLAETAAWLVVMSVGTLLAGVALAEPATTAAVIYYLPHSTLAAAALFLLADLIARARGAKEDRLTDGAAQPRPALMGALYLLAAMAFIGLPPLSGFIGKIALMRGTPPEGPGGLYWFLLLLGGLLALIALSRAGTALFWRPRREPMMAGHDRVRLAAAAAPVILLLGWSLYAEWGITLGKRVAAQLHDPQAYIEAVLGTPDAGGQP